MKQIKPGQKVKCIALSGTTYGPFLPYGQEVTVSGIHNKSGINASFRTKEFPNSVFYMREFEALPGTLADFQDEQKTLEAALTTVKQKIAYMEKNKVDEYDDTQFKAYTTLQILKTKHTDIEKAKIIADLING